MFSHEALWRALDLVAHQNGLSPSGFAVKAGLDPTSLNPSKRINPRGAGAMAIDGILIQAARRSRNGSRSFREAGGSLL